MERALTWNFGGGTQSVAIAVLLARGKLPRPERIVIADTSREASETWSYADAYVRPLLAPLGLQIEVAPHSLATVDLYAKNGQLLIPAFSQKGMNETWCSAEWKAYVAERFYRSVGYGPKRPIKTWIGISLDEMGRAHPGKRRWQKLYWPLLFDVPMRREECRTLVLSEGLPEPPKSSCWMCPYRKNAQWRKLRDEWPEDFERACVLDAELRASADRQVYLHKSRVPLREADLSEPDALVAPLFGEVEHCDSGHCWV